MLDPKKKSLNFHSRPRKTRQAVLIDLNTNGIIRTREPAARMITHCLTRCTVVKLERFKMALKFLVAWLVGA